MKTKILLLIISSTFLASCKEACYECTFSTLGASVKVDICEGKACTSGTCVDLDEGQTNKEAADEFEAAGYTCSQK